MGTFRGPELLRSSIELGPFIEEAEPRLKRALFEEGGSSGCWKEEPELLRGFAPGTC
jgi:hypothetical protein